MSYTETVTDHNGIVQSSKPELLAAPWRREGTKGHSQPFGRTHVKFLIPKKEFDAAWEMTNTQTGIPGDEGWKGVGAILGFDVDVSGGVKITPLEGMIEYSPSYGIRKPVRVPR